MVENARTPFRRRAIRRTVRSAVNALADRYRIVRWLVPYVHVAPPESGVEVRTTVDWQRATSYVMPAPAGAVALVRLFDDRGVDVVDLMPDPVIAFAFDRYPRKTITIRNQGDRDVCEDWLTGDEIEPITLSGADRADVVATAIVLPDGSVTWGGFLYASLAKLLEEKRSALLTK